MQGDSLIPPGGIGEPLPQLYETTDNGVRFIGDIWQRRRQGEAAYTMVKQGRFSYKDGLLGLYAHSGEHYDAVLQEAQLARLVPTLSSWVLGFGSKPRSQTDAEISEMWEAQMTIREAREGMTREEYSQAWDNLRKQYPMLSYVMMARGSADERDENLIWEVLSWQPPGWQKHQHFENLGVMELLSQFYSDKGDMSEWARSDRQQLVGATLNIAEMTEPPMPTEANKWAEYNAAKRGVDSEAREKFGDDIFEVQSAYFEAEDRPGYLEKNPELAKYWAWRDEANEEYPSLSQFDRRPRSHWTERDAANAFYTYWKSAVPPGQLERRAKREIPLLDVIRDFELRTIAGLDWTVEQYSEALKLTQFWLQDNQAEIYGGSAEWNEARDLAAQFYEIRDRRFSAGLESLLDRYYQAGKEQKAFLVQENPELEKFLEFQDQYAVAHPVYAKYYARDLYEELELGPPEPIPVYGEGPIPQVIRPGTREGEAGFDRRDDSYPRRATSWNEMVSRMKRAELEALFAVWMGDPEDEHYESLYQAYLRHGWGEFDQWVQDLEQLYRNAQGEVPAPQPLKPAWEG